jgi:hypothetical protein
MFDIGDITRKFKEKPSIELPMRTPFEKTILSRIVYIFNILLGVFAFGKLRKLLTKTKNNNKVEVNLFHKFSDRWSLFNGKYFLVKLATPYINNDKLVVVYMICYNDGVRDFPEHELDIFGTVLDIENTFYIIKD